MMYYPNINPELISFYGISIKWYGFCHVIAVLLFYWYALKIKPNNFTKDNIADLMFYLCLGVLLGGKIGYIMFYDPSDILINPFNLLKFWLPGRSFHGGLLGVIIAIYLYSKKYKFSFLEVTDFVSPIFPIGIVCGRVGNFINGELWGRVTNVPWAMIFPHVDDFPRHPSQIYEILLEGILLFLILNFLSNIKFLKKFNIILNNKTALFLIFYAIFRIYIENYREPDLGKGIIALGMTMGQILSIPMLILGIGLLFARSKFTLKVQS